MKDKITVVIPCYNELLYIGNLLDDLANQYGIKGVNVIIADNNSNDGTLSVIQDKKNKYNGLLNIKVVDGGNVSRARNNGSEFVETLYIGFIDADVRLYSTTQIWDTIQNLEDGYELITCKLKSYGDKKLTGWLYSLYNFIHSYIIKYHPFAIGAYMFMETNKFREFGKFDEWNDNSEDFLFSQNFKVDKFLVQNHFIGQDDRRFERLGYWGMVKHMTKNYIKFLKGDLEHFKTKTSYWNHL